MKPRREKATVRQVQTDDEQGLFLKGKGPVAIGTGLVALDIVVTDREGARPRCWAGGTCGNVLAILAYLGWRSYPAAPLGEDTAADRILEDLRHFGVKTRFLQRSETRHTPIVVERIRKCKSGMPRHRFVWTCPNCGAWLPAYQALRATEARVLASRMPNPSVFFFDRVSRGAIDLARASAALGALVVFEPSGVRDERLFREAIGLSHVVKYSHERLGRLRETLRFERPLLEIETLGQEGLRYRAGGGKKQSTRWIQMAAYPVAELRDTAGAGDWCTAGILHSLGRHGAHGLRAASDEQIENALRLGQALGAVKCRHEGARGTMYALTRRKLESAVAKIIQGDTPSCVEDDTEDRQLGDLLQMICPFCDKTRAADA